MPPRVTIGLPVFNGMPQLEVTLASLVSQTYGNLEICVSDNASTDGSLDHVHAAAALDTRIRVRAHSANFGINANFRAVLEMAHGAYFCWAAADDLYDPRFLEMLCGELESHPHAAAAMCATRQIDEDGEYLRTIRYHGPDSPNRLSPLRQSLRLITASTVIKKKKYNLLIMGLYKTTVLKRVIKRHPTIISMGDRVLPAAIALSGGYRYVDEELYTKRVANVRFANRQPQDPFVSGKKNVGRIGYLARSIRWLTTTPTIPNFRKAMIPAIPIIFISQICRYRIINQIRTVQAKFTSIYTNKQTH